VLLIKVVRNEIGKGNYLELMLTVLVISVLAFISLYSFGESSATLGWRQILAPGGVHKPNIQLTILLLITYFLYVAFNHSKKSSDYSFLIAMSGTLSMVVLVVLNLVYTKGIQYYSVKQFYLWSALVSVVIFRFLISEKTEHRFLMHSVMSKAFVVVPVTSVILSLNASNGFMQDLPNSLLAITNQNNSQSYLVNGSKQVQLSNIDTLSDNTCLFYRVGGEESDLNSRWANALSSPIFMPEDCFGIYWNSSNLSLKEIESRAELKKTPFVYVLSANSKSKFQELIERNRYFIIGRELSGERNLNE
jgi:hypothetical protein